MTKERVDRDALIEAAAKAIDDQVEGDSYGPNQGSRLLRHITFPECFGERAGWAVLQAVLPLIADAIEAELYEPWRHRTATPHDRALRKAAHLVRSLGDEQ